MQNTVDFDETYRCVRLCIDNYLILKPEGKWVDKIRAFQQNELIIIYNSRSLKILKEKLEIFCKCLRSFINKISLGFIGGSTLKSQLEVILANMNPEIFSDSTAKPDTVIQATDNISDDVADFKQGNVLRNLSCESSPSFFLAMVPSKASSTSSVHESMRDKIAARAARLTNGQPTIVPGLLVTPCTCPTPTRRGSPNTLSFQSPIEASADDGKHPIAFGFQLNKFRTSNNTGV